MREERRGLSCRSAQPDMAGVRVFGIIGGSVEPPRVEYLKESAAIDASVFDKLANVQPTHVFRFSAKCEEYRCAHYNGRRCILGQRIVDKLDPMIDMLPPWLVRPTCRWFAQLGAAECQRCPQVVTLIPKGDDNLNQAARVKPLAVYDRNS
jgi:hypothetical protein